MGLLRSHPFSKALQCAAFVALFPLAAPSFAAAHDVLGAGDKIHVTVFQNPDLTTDARLSARGTVSLPLIGRVALAGLTTERAAARIAARLKKGRFLVHPQVDVTVLDVRSRRVSVLGHVARPGQYPLDGEDLKLTDALALAGGIRDDGADKVIVVTKRKGKVERLRIDVPKIYRSGDLSADIVLQSGDTVFVPSAPVFYVYGAVRKAGAYRLQPGTTVLDALSLGGGLAPRGSERGISIRRRMPNGDLRQIKATLADTVQAGDVIDVKPSLF